MKELGMVSRADAKEAALQMAEKTSYLWLVVSVLWSIVAFSATHNFWLSVFGPVCGVTVVATVRYLNYGARFVPPKKNGAVEEDEDDEPDD